MSSYLLLSSNAAILVLNKRLPGSLKTNHDGPLHRGMTVIQMVPQCKVKIFCEGTCKMSVPYSQTATAWHKTVYRWCNITIRSWVDKVEIAYQVVKCFARHDRPYIYAFIRYNCRPGLVDLSRCSCTLCIQWRSQSRLVGLLVKRRWWMSFSMYVLVAKKISRISRFKILYV
jgi:hypothetical protein